MEWDLQRASLPARLSKTAGEWTEEGKFKTALFKVVGYKE